MTNREFLLESNYPIETVDLMDDWEMEEEVRKLLDERDRLFS